MYDNMTINETARLMNILNFLIDHGVIDTHEYDWWEINEEVPLDKKQLLLSITLDYINNRQNELIEDRYIKPKSKSKELRYLKYMQDAITDELYNVNKALSEGEK